MKGERWIEEWVYVDRNRPREGFPPWSLSINATLDEFNDMDSVEVLLWQRNGSVAFD